MRNINLNGCTTAELLLKNKLATEQLDVDLSLVEEDIRYLNENKQEVLTAGENIIIEDNVISASGGGGGGGEQWKDITDLFTASNSTYSNTLTSDFVPEDVNAKGVFRIYLETLNSGPFTKPFVGNTRVFMFTIGFNSLDAGFILNFSTGTIIDQSEGVYLGELHAYSSESVGLTIVYSYGVELSAIEPDQAPKIFKIERLVEND